MHGELGRDHQVGSLCETPSAMPGQDAATVFFDCLLEPSDALAATCRFRTVSGDADTTFLTLIGSDALVFLADCRPERREASLAALRSAQQHYETYRKPWAQLPKVVYATHTDDETAQPVDGVLRALGVDDLPRVDPVVEPGSLLRALADAVAEAVLAGFQSGSASGRPTRSPSKAYMEHARALAAAAEIAAKVRPGGPIALERAVPTMALNPELGFAKVSSLKHLEGAFLTYWTEGSGPDVDAFWDEVAKQDLPYRRGDLVRAVLERGRIRDDAEAELVADLLSDVSQRRFSDAEVEQLTRIFQTFEAKVAKR